MRQWTKHKIILKRISLEKGMKCLYQMKEFTSQERGQQFLKICATFISYKEIKIKKIVFTLSQ